MRGRFAEASKATTGSTQAGAGRCGPTYRRLHQSRGFSGARGRVCRVLHKPMVLAGAIGDIPAILD